MRFFTRQWHAGEHADWSDEEYREVGVAYRRYVSSVADQLPIEVLALARIDLHDGLIKTFSINENRQTLMRVRCGDSSTVGYYDVDLLYQDAVVTERETGDVLAVVGDPETEVLYDEVNATGDSTFEHRLLLWPRGVLIIRFKNLELSQNPVANR
jgi:hypothetical protein